MLSYIYICRVGAAGGGGSLVPYVRHDGSLDSADRSRDAETTQSTTTRGGARNAGQSDITSENRRQEAKMKLNCVVRLCVLLQIYLRAGEAVEMQHLLPRY